MTNVTRVTPLAKYEYCSWIGGGIVTAAEVAAARTHNRPGSIFRSNSVMIFDTFERNDFGKFQNVKLFIAFFDWLDILSADPLKRRGQLPTPPPSLPTQLKPCDN